MASRQHTRGRVGILLVLLAAWTLLLFRLGEAPPGLQHDQMFNSLDALSVGRGNFPIYFPANFGRELLGIYPVALVFELAGGHYLWSIRFTSVLWGMLAVSLTFVLARRYLPPGGALAAAALLAGSFWFLFTARLGLEPALLIPLATASIYFLNRGLAGRAWRDFAAAGVAGGLAVHTYLASRGLFLLVALLAGYEAFFWLLRRLRGQRTTFRHTAIPGLFVTLLVMAAISAPLFVYLQTRPNTGDLRVGELGGAASAALAGNLRPLLANVAETVSAVLWAGPESLPYHYNVPGRPVLLPVLAVFFVIGLVVTLARLRRSTEFLLAAALLVGLLPDFVTGADALHMRGVIALPLIFVITARGLWETGRWATLRLSTPGSADPDPQSRRRRTWSHLGAGLLLALVIWNVAATGVAYFVDWTQAQPTQRIYNADYRAIASWLDANPTDASILIGSNRLLDLDRKVYELYQPAPRETRWFPAEESLPLPVAGKALYFLPATTDLPAPATARLAAAAGRRFTLPGPGGGYDLVHAFELTPEDVARVMADASMQPLAAPPVYGQAVRLDAAGAHQHGGAVDLLTQWSVVGPWPHLPPPGLPRQPIKVSASLVDETGYKWAQSDQPSGLPWGDWRAGDSYLELISLPLPADLPPGTYAVRLALYDDVGGTVLASAAGGIAAADAPVAAVAVAQSVAGPAPAAPYPFERTAGGDALAPAGRWEPLDVLLAGVPGDLHLSWRAGAALDTQGLGFLARATEPDGTVIWEQVADPLQPLPAVWPAGQTYRLTHRVVPQAAPAGVNGVRLEVCAQQHDVELACGLAGQPQVIDQPPKMDLPRTPDFPIDLTWDRRFSLLGYDVAPTPAGLAATLYWRVGAAPAASLTRFVHAVDSAGQIVAQADAVPANGSLPMPSWRAGEIVVDTVTLSAPADRRISQLCVGWYQPESGERLPVRLSNGEDAPDRQVCLPLVE